MAERVPPEGPLDAKIVIVGESPGRTEVQRGRPFVGQAGAILDDLLASAGLRRSDIYITNTVKVLPTYENDKDEFFFNTVYRTKTIVQSKTPTMEYVQGIVELHGELKTIRENGGANVVVPLGNYALWALTQNWGISKWRGSIIESTLIPGLKVIPTLHPAFYSYEGKPERKLLGNWDFIRIAKHSRSREIPKIERRFITDPTPEEIKTAIEIYTDPSLSHITVDSEWYSPDSLAYVAFGANNTDAICIVPNSMLAFRAIKEILGSPIPKVWQNAMFDAVALYRLGIQVNNVAHDLMLEWWYAWGNVIGAKGLDVITSVLTEQPYYKDDIEFVGRDDRGQIYCCTDVVVTNEGHETMFAEEFPMTGTQRGYEISISIMNKMIRAAQVGILADVEKLRALRAKKLENARERNAALCQKLGISSLNVRSWQQVQRIVYDDLGFGKRFTQRSTDQKVLMNIAATLYAENPEDENVKILIDIIRERQDLNVCSRYINEGIVDRDGRIKTNWNLAGTKNGRLSSTIPWWNGVALQTMPDEAREICIPDPGHVFIGWDLAQAEARIVAVLARDFDLLEAMERGVDIHVLLAAMLPFGLSYEEHMEIIRRDYTSQGRSKDEYAPRYLSKRTRHASNYIQSAVGLQEQINKDFLDTMIGVNRAQANQLNDGFIAASPGLESWWMEVLEFARANRYLENDFGRRRQIFAHLEWKNHDHRDCVAFRPQSDVSDLTTLSIRDLPDDLLVLAHMHDGGLIQVPENRKDEALEIVQKTMTREIVVEGVGITIPVDLKFGYNWKEMQPA